MIFVVNDQYVFDIDRKLLQNSLVGFILAATRSDNSDLCSEQNVFRLASDKVLMEGFVQSDEVKERVRLLIASASESRIIYRVGYGSFLTSYLEKRGANVQNWTQNYFILSRINCMKTKSSSEKADSVEGSNMILNSDSASCRSFFFRSNSLSGERTNLACNEEKNGFH